MSNLKRITQGEWRRLPQEVKRCLDGTNPLYQQHVVGTETILCYCSYNCPLQGSMKIGNYKRPECFNGMFELEVR